MKRLLSTFTGLFATLNAVLVAVIGVGRGAPLPPSIQALGFDLCGDVACFMGMQPGLTPWTDAQTVMAKLQDSNVWHRRMFVKSSVGSEAVLYPSFNGDSIGRVYITPARGSPIPAGWIVERYGPPCSVSIFYETGIVILRYPFMLANLRIARSHLDSYSPVIQLQLTDPSFFSKAEPNPCTEKVTGWKVETRTWQGFASMRSYLER